ncbi:nSTAND1 domain-containing NTPase [Chitinophaga pinensis]|nr:ATP-binding protein [Chitinophaga pinensis]
MMKLMENPFKLLESYTKEDKDIWGGRSAEIEHLYNLSFAANLILVYGMSGVGKTSLIQCGLANKFRRTDWHAVWITRKEDLNKSLTGTLSQEAGDSPSAPPSPVPEIIRRVYLKHFKPIFLVFDQLEELFIFGSNGEIQAFIGTIKEILSSDIQCKIILVVREEYHGHLKILQDAGLPVFKASVKIEPMSIPEATEAVSKLLDKYNIQTPDADHRSCAAKIATDCSIDSRVDLANLQVYLFWAWEKAAEKAPPDADIAFTHNILREIGDGRNVLTRYLNAVVERVSKGKTGGVWFLLQHFVSRSQTKQPLRLAELQDIDQQTARMWLNELSKSKLVKCGRETDNEVYNLTHDSLVPLIILKKTAASRGRNIHPSVKGNPFKGLPAYEEKDATIFFGRSLILRELLTFFEDKRLLVIVGPSGSGKSSIIKAGIIPALKTEGYTVIHGEPGTHPMVFGREIQRRLTDLNGGRSLIYIDQFEELSTQASTQESEEFIRLLNDVQNNADPALRQLKIILSVRADYEYEFERALGGWREAKKTIPDLMESAVREIITEPAYLAGLEYKPTYLVDNIVRDVMQSNGTLPLLSYALEQMYIEYEKSGVNDGFLTEDHYNAIGGVVDGLRLRASKLYSYSDPETQHTIKNVMLRMLSLSINEKASKRILAEDLVYESPVENERVQKVLNELVNSRLIVSGPDENGQIYYEPAHDSLIRSWNLIGDWIKQYGKDLLYLQQDLSDAVKQFRLNPKKLWHDDPKLNTLLNIMKSPDNWLNRQETNFVKKSLQRRNELEDRKKRREQELVEEKISRQEAVAKLSTEKEKREKELLEEKLSKQEAIAKLNSEKEAVLLEKLKGEKAKTRLQKQRTILLALGLISLLIAASYVYSQWNKSEKSVLQIKELNHRLQSSADDLTKLNQSLNVIAEKARQSAVEANIARQKADSAASKEKKARTIVEKQKKELLIKQNALISSQEEVKRYSLSLQAKADSLRTYSDSLKTQLVIIQNKTREVEHAKLTAAYLTKSRSLMHSDPAMAYQLALESLKYDSGNQKIKNYIHDTLNNRNTFYESFIVDNVSSAFFADNGKTVLAIQGDNKFRLLDLSNHKDTSIVINGKILSAQFSPVDNSALIATRNNIFSYNANGGLRATSERMENVVKAMYTARGRIIVVTPAEVQIRKNVNATTAVVIPSGNNGDDTEVSSNDSLLYIRKNDVIEAYDLTNGRLIRTYQEPNSFLAKGGNGFIAVSGKRLLLARSAGNKVLTERYFVPLEKDYSRVSIVSIADNLRTLLFMAEPAEQQQMQQQQQVQQQQISKNFIRPQLTNPPILYAFSLPKSSRKLPGNIPYARRVVLSENGNYIITGESGSLSIYDNNGYRVENFGGYANYTIWAFNPVNTDMIMSMNGVKLKLWLKGTPDALSAQRKLRTFSSAELEKALEDIAIR